LGLVEDIRSQSLSPSFRLLVKLLIFGFVFLQWPGLVPNSVGIPILDSLLSIPVLAFILTLVFCVGFLNAMNMADGANGLVSGIAVLSFTIFVNEFDGLGFAAVLITCSVFLIFNVVSGRLFLGDAGSYGVGASLLITSLVIYAEGMASLSFLAALLSYPCIDFLVTVIRRLLKRTPIMRPDNNHLHNHIHHWYRKVFNSKNIANSASGLSIAAASSGTVLFGYYANWWPMTSDQWIWVFYSQCGLYLVTYYFTRNTSSVNKSAQV
jgi:UDP-GlcNAc:undecaprenyl-phosphate GlcNAc-1-phosphate transferase